VTLSNAPAKDDIANGKEYKKGWLSFFVLGFGFV
jgi:hypothetical protein